MKDLLTLYQKDKPSLFCRENAIEKEWIFYPLQEVLLRLVDFAQFLRKLTKSFLFLTFEIISFGVVRCVSQPLHT